MTEDPKNPVRGMFDASSEETSGDEGVPDEPVAIPEKDSEEKNTAEKMFDAPPKEDEIRVEGAPSVPPPRMDFGGGKLTAEEKLLRVIDGDDSAPEGRKFAWLKLPNLQDITGMGGDLTRRIREGWFGLHFNLALFNKGLLAAILFLAVISVANVFAFKPDIKNVHNRVAKLESHAIGSSLVLYKPLEEYLSSVGERSLFHPVTNDNNKAPAGAPGVPSGTEDKVLGDLQLVGIAWGEYPEAMIRDKGDGRTYFLKKNQQFKGIKVLEVSKDRVLVEYGGKTKELM